MNKLVMQIDNICTLKKIMIAWLKGKKIYTWRQGARQGIVLDCAGVGYEVQLLPRSIIDNELTELIELWVHQQYRDDGFTLFGFSGKEERDIFRILIAVNGVGPQIAIALLQEFKAAELIELLNQENIMALTEAQGVGKKIAERLIVELRNKLKTIAEEKIINEKDEKNIAKNTIPKSILNELQGTLLGLGYEDFEIRNAIKAVSIEMDSEKRSSTKSEALSNTDTDEWLRASLSWLSKQIS